MRFCAPRSTSPSPERERAYRRSTFRAPSDSSDSSDSEDDLENNLSDYELQVPVSESSSESSDSDSDTSLTQTIVRRRDIPREELREIEDTVTAIRVRTRHKDPYEEWERQTRKDAFHSARKQQAHVQLDFRERREDARAQHERHVHALRESEMQDMQRQLEALDLQRHQEEQRILNAWKERDRLLWERIEKSIKEEEDKVRARLEAERKLREEAERQRKAEEERRRQEEERRRQKEETERREEEERKKKIDDERLRKEAEEKEKANHEAMVRQRQEQEKGADSLRETSGLPRLDELWLAGLRTLHRLKSETMRAVKGPKSPDPEPANYTSPPPPPLKKIWSAQRRKITPKVGQLTNDSREIARITEELRLIVAPIQGAPESLHHALLSSLSKIIIRQAETEVTAHKEQAVPLAQLTVNLLSIYPLLADIFWAKLCELAGCWIVPIAASDRDLDVLVPDGSNPVRKEKLYLKLWSKRPDELQDAQTTRITGVLRLYFHMLFVPVANPLPPQFRPARYWTYLSQLLSTPAILERVVAPEAIYVALDVAGTQAKSIWGRQWIKLLAHIYGTVQGDGKERIGGNDPAAQASRVRCQLDIETIMSEA